MKSAKIDRARNGMMMTALCSMLLACGIHVDYTPLNPAPREMHVRMPAEVEVFADGVEPSRRYVEVGTIDARRQAKSHASKEEMITKIRDVAARRGCEAVKIVGRADESDRIGYRAACLVYADTSAVASAATQERGAPGTTGAEVNAGPPALAATAVAPNPYATAADSGLNAAPLTSPSTPTTTK